MKIYTFNNLVAIQTRENNKNVGRYKRFFRGECRKYTAINLLNHI